MTLQSPTTVVVDLGSLGVQHLTRCIHRRALPLTSGFFEPFTRLGFFLSGDLKTGLSVNRPRASASHQHASLLLPMKMSLPGKDWFCEIPFPQP